jgi:pilus assembly protein CpaC
MYPSPRSAAALALMWLGLAATAFAAQPNASGAAARAHPPYAGEPSQIPANGKPIVLEVGKGTLIRLSRPASTVFVASPDIADVQIKSPELIYVSAKAPGQTVIYAVDGGDTVLLNAPVRVDFDLSELRQSLNRLVPGTDISVTQVDSSLVLSGAVASAGQAEKARALATAVAGAVKSGQVINRLSVETPNQVNLQVRFAEVDRNILKQIGVDWSKIGTSPAIGTAVSGPAVSLLTANSPTPLINAITIGTFPSLFGQTAQRHDLCAGDRGVPDRSCRA